MSITKRLLIQAASAATVMMIVVGWYTFAPRQVGGRAAYIIVIGNSMEPGFKIGDLVITHAEASYQPGDAVVYRNQELQNFVFHRIISQELGHYTLQGDNNAWVDTYQPSREEVIGKLWLRVPRSGGFIQRIRSPFNMALIAGALGATLASSLFPRKAKDGNRMKKISLQERLAFIVQKLRALAAPAMDTLRKPAANVTGENLDGVFFALSLIALFSLITGIIAFSRPASRTVQDDISYEHIGVFSYSAAAPQGVYDSNVVQGGDPVFTRLTCAINVNFQYTLVAAQTAGIAGTHQLTAVLSEPVSGWQRTIPLQEKAAFTGGSFNSSAVLDLCKIEALTQSMEEGTNFHPSGYILTLLPNIEMSGQVASRALQDTFNKPLTFRYDRIQFYLVREEGAGDALIQTQTGVMKLERTVDNSILLFGRELAIPALRLTAVIGLLGSLIGLAFVGLQLRKLSQADQSRFLRIKYGSLIVDIEHADSLAAPKMIDVTSMDALAKLAERSNVLILHSREGGNSRYFVQSAGMIYRFVATDEGMETTLPLGAAHKQESGT